MLSRAGLTVARFALAAWVGAAALFVVTGVIEVTSTIPYLADSTVRDALVAVRFPAYYVFGFALVGVAAIGLAAAFRNSEMSRIRYLICFGLIIVSLVLMVIDYQMIYQELLTMVSPPGKAKSSDFRKFHEASKHINMLSVGLLLVSSLLLNWPTAPQAPRAE